MLSKRSLEFIAWCDAGCPLPGDRPTQPGVGLHLPWLNPLSADDVRLIRIELKVKIEALAKHEGWAHEYLDDVLSRAIHGPLSDLLPTLNAINECVAEVNAEQEAREISKARSCRPKGFADRRRNE